jgi:hypothetical protein
MNKSIKTVAFWNVAPCNLAEQIGYIVLEKLDCIHLQGPEEGIKSKIRISANIGRYKYYKQNCSQLMMQFYGYVLCVDVTK